MGYKFAEDLCSTPVDGRGETFPERSVCWQFLPTALFSRCLKVIFKSTLQNYDCAATTCYF